MLALLQRRSSLVNSERIAAPNVQCNTRLAAPRLTRTRKHTRQQLRLQPLRVAEVEESSPSAAPSVLAEHVLLSPAEPLVEAIDAPTTAVVVEESCNVLVKGKDRIVRSWDAALGSPTEEVPYRNLCSMVEQVAALQHHTRRFDAADGLTMYLAVCMLAETYNDGGMISGPMTPSKRVHELSDALIEAFLQTWLDERINFENWVIDACHQGEGLLHVSWAQPMLPTSVRCYLMGQLEFKLLEARKAKPTRNEYDRKLQRFRLWYNRRCIWLNLPGLMFSMNGSELAGFVHGSEVEEPLHLSAVVHPQILYPPDHAPPARVQRTVVVYLMQSFAGQGKGVGKSIVHALRAHGVSAQNPTRLRQQQQQHQQQGEALEPQAGAGSGPLPEQQPAGQPVYSLERLTSVQILQQLLDERAADAKWQQRRRQHPQEAEREREEGLQATQPQLAGPSAMGDGGSSSSNDSRGMGSNGSSSDAGRQDAGHEWLVLADAPMENARPFWHKMNVPVAIASSFTRDAWVDLGWHASDSVQIGPE